MPTIRNFFSYCLATLSVFLISHTSHAFWVVNFGSAKTLAPMKFAFAAGLGGQMVFVGEPRTTSAFFMIPHAGFRLGLTRSLDVGLRLAPVPVPYSTVGPGFGMNVDLKWCFTKPESKFSAALIAGAGTSHLVLRGDTRLAHTVNFAGLLSVAQGEKNTWTLMARNVNIAIPTANEGASGNYVHVNGLSLGLKHQLLSNLAILPELGTYWYQGKILGQDYNGPGVQYGIMVSTTF